MLPRRLCLQVNSTIRRQSDFGKKEWVWWCAHTQSGNCDDRLTYVEFVSSLLQIVFVVPTSGHDLTRLEPFLPSDMNVSVYRLSGSRDTVMLNARVRELAFERIAEFVRQDPTFLKGLHHEWLVHFKSSLSKMDSNSLIDDVIYRLVLKYRLSAMSTMKAVKSLVN